MFYIQSIAITCTVWVNNAVTFREIKNLEKIITIKNL